MMVACVVFVAQDYNRQVLSALTIPNVQLNKDQLPASAVRERTRYYAGDWMAVGQLLTSQGLGGYYDIILTAETIYNQESQERLLECIKQVSVELFIVLCRPQALCVHATCSLERQCST